ncbi:MAG TPA: UMP kinase [Methanoregulaceae archaeon]|nr:UMP kinase [Methanoregulaceae archaeon]
MKTVVLSLGGSILLPSIESNTIHSYAPVLRNIARNVLLFVVVGGGGEARRYISAARTLKIDEATCDEIGIMITRLNAALLVGALGTAAYPRVAENQTQALEFGVSGKIVVMGGVTPGQTTDAVAAVLAERAGADILINATSVDGIYSADPKIDPSAKRFQSLTPSQLVEIVSGDSLSAGSNAVVDMVAAKIVQRSRIPLAVLDGRDPKNLENALNVGAFQGTIVTGSGNSPLPL